MRLNQKIGAAPEALEHGGQSVVVTGRRSAASAGGFALQARPFMGPALKKEAPKFAGMWANSIR